MFADSNRSKEEYVLIQYTDLSNLTNKCLSE